MREMFKSALMMAKCLGKENKVEEITIDFDCPDCGDKMIGVENNVTYEFKVPKKRCKCQCGYKGFYPVNREEDNHGME